MPGHFFCFSRRDPFAKLMASFIVFVVAEIFVIKEYRETIIDSTTAITAREMESIPVRSEGKNASLRRRMQRMELKANNLLRESNREGLPHATDGEIHYKFSEFQLSLGHSSSFKFYVHNIKIPDMELDEAGYRDTTDKIVCPMRGPLVHKFQHFPQDAFPCWSVLQRFPNAQRFVMLPNVRRADLKSTWISALLQVFESAGIAVLDKETNLDFSSIALAVHIDPSPSGWPPETKSSFQFERGNTVYFLNQSDVQSLQKYALGDDFDAKRSAESLLPLRVLLVERRKFSREWIHCNETARRIEAVWGGDGLVETKILPNPTGSLRDQAREFHEADIIVSPHGAQLTNLAFIRPCTSVLELFPAHYYLGFYQPYVLSAGGMSYDGYPFDRSPLYDTKVTEAHGKDYRAILRQGPVMASPQSILRAFPRLVLSTLSCLRSSAGA